MTLPAPTGCRYVLRLAKRRPLTWTLWLLCYDPALKRWGFRRWEVYACVTGHFKYCVRRDRSRNLRVEATACVRVEQPACVGSRQRCEDRLMEELRSAIGRAELRAEEMVEECTSCFDIGLSELELGYHFETEDMTICMYDRCDGVWRTRVEDCIFKRI